MKISKQELIEMGACKSGLERFIEQTNDTDKAVDVADLVGGLNTYSDLLWLADKKLSHERIIRFAKDCALINIKLIKNYTDKYDLIVEFLVSDMSYNSSYFAAHAYFSVCDAAAHAAAHAAAACACYYACYYACHYICYTGTARIAEYAANVSKESEDKVNQLLIDMFNEVE